VFHFGQKWCVRYSYRLFRARCAPLCPTLCNRNLDLGRIEANCAAMVSMSGWRLGSVNQRRFVIICVGTSSRTPPSQKYSKNVNRKPSKLVIHFNFSTRCKSYQYTEGVAIAHRLQEWRYNCGKFIDRTVTSDCDSSIDESYPIRCWKLLIWRGCRTGINTWGFCNPYGWRREGLMTRHMCRREWKIDLIHITCITF
jgi:hypothetical protein